MNGDNMDEYKINRGKITLRVITISLLLILLTIPLFINIFFLFFIRNTNLLVVLFISLIGITIIIASYLKYLILILKKNTLIINDNYIQVNNNKLKWNEISLIKIYKSWKIPFSITIIEIDGIKISSADFHVVQIKKIIKLLDYYAKIYHININNKVIIK